MKTFEYTNEAQELNAKLEIKKIKGLRFRVIGKIIVVMTGTYGVYIEGKGFIQWKHQNAPICGTKKWLTECYTTDGFLSYDGVTFVNPIN